MPVSRVVVRVEKAAGCPLARRRSPCRWRRNCRSCHREQSSKGPISSLRPQTGGAGASRSLAYLRGIRAGKMLTIACSWFKSAGPRVGGGAHPGCTKSLATLRPSKAVALPGRGGAGSAPGVRFARAGGRRARSSVPAAAMEKRMVASFWRPQRLVLRRSACPWRAQQ